MDPDELTIFPGTGRAGRLSVRVGAILFLSVIGAGVTHAQQESQADRAMRKAQGMLRQLSSEKKALEARNVELEAESAKVKAEVSQVQAEVGQQQSIHAAMAANNAALVERIKSDYGKIQEIIAKYRAQQAELRLYQHDHVLLENAVVERDEWISDCRKNNASLIAAGKELLVRYNNKSVWDSIGGLEPVLGIGKVGVEIENQEYRFKLEDLKVQPPDASAVPLKTKQAGVPPQPEDSDEPSEK